MGVIEVAASAGRGGFRRGWKYQPMATLHARGYVARQADPRRARWSLWTVTDAGLAALDAL
jgi:hypothetical protein